MPYKGGTTQITGLLAGDIQLGMESANVAIPLWRESKIKILGLTGGKRIADRAGDPDGRRDAAGLRPRHLAERGGAGRHAEGDRRAALRLARQGDGERGGASSKLLAVGIEPTISKSPEEFAAFIKSQAATREKVIKAVGMKLD